MKPVPRPSSALEAAAQPKTPHLRLIPVAPMHPEGFMSEYAHQQYLTQKAMLDENGVNPKTASALPPLQQQDNTPQYAQKQQMQQQQAGALLPKTP